MLHGITNILRKTLVGIYVCKIVKILLNIHSNYYTKCISNELPLELLQILTSKLNSPGQMFCDLGKIRDFFLISKSEAETAKKLLCSDSWKNYVSDLIGSFGVRDVKTNVSKL